MSNASYRKITLGHHLFSSHISITYDFFAHLLMLFTSQTLQFQTPSHQVQVTKHIWMFIPLQLTVVHESMKQNFRIPSAKGTQ